MLCTFLPPRGRTSHGQKCVLHLKVMGSFINGINQMHFRLYTKMWTPLAANFCLLGMVGDVNGINLEWQKKSAIFIGKMMFCTFLPVRRHTSHGQKRVLHLKAMGSFINGINPMHFRLYSQIWPALAANSCLLRMGGDVNGIYMEWQKNGKWCCALSFHHGGALVVVKNVRYTSKPWVFH